jgi:hypothetical protein
MIQLISIFSPERAKFNIVVLWMIGETSEMRLIIFVA